MVINEQFGSKMQKIRESKGLSRDELAERVGKSMQYIAMLERDSRSPSMKSFVKITESLGVLPNDLLCEMDQTQKGERFLRYFDYFKVLPKEKEDEVCAMLEGLFRCYFSNNPMDENEK